jgi:hypothetical protein
VSLPALPRTHDHPLWAAWDSAVDGVLAQLPALFGYNLLDVMRMSALHLTPDLSRLRNLEWGDMVPLPPENEPTQVIPNVVANSVPLSAATMNPLANKPGGSTVSRFGRTSLARSSAGGSKSTTASPTAPAATLIPFDMSAFAVDALSIPPSASATAGERVRMLRRRLERVAHTTSMGAAPTFAPLGLAAFVNSTYFDDQVQYVSSNKRICISYVLYFTQFSLRILLSDVVF